MTAPTPIVLYPLPPDDQLALVILLAVTYVVIRWAWRMWVDPVLARWLRYRPCDIREREALRELRRAER